MKGPQYLGDAVYVRWDGPATFSGATLCLYTHDGIMETNTIYLEPDVLQKLLEYLKPEGSDAISSQAENT